MRSDSLSTIPGRKEKEGEATVSAPAPASSPPARRLAARRLALGAAALDAELGGGLKSDGLHEFYAARPEDGVCALGFALALARRRQAEDDRPLLWARMGRGNAARALPYGPGLVELGLEPGRIALLLLPDAKALLRAGLDAIRAGAAGTVLIDIAGPCPLLDLTASRRMTLAAAESDTMVLLARSGAGTPVPSAAHSRWEVAAAPSLALETDAPGAPGFALTLLRQRGGRDGVRGTLAWDREGALFRERDAVPVERSIPHRRAANDRWGSG